MVPNDLEDTTEGRTQGDQLHTIYTNKKIPSYCSTCTGGLYCIETMRALLDIQSAFSFSWYGGFFFERFCISVSVYNKL